MGLSSARNPNIGKWDQLIEWLLFLSLAALVCLFTSSWSIAWGSTLYKYSLKALCGWWRFYPLSQGFLDCGISGALRPKEFDRNGLH